MSDKRSPLIEKHTSPESENQSNISDAPMKLSNQAPQTVSQRDNSSILQQQIAQLKINSTKFIKKKLLVKRNILTFSVIAIVILVGIMSYTLYAHLAPANVVAFQVGKKQDVSQYVGGGGLIYPVQQINISYPVAERVIDVVVKAGQRVQAGDALIKLSPTKLNSEVQMAADTVEAARSYLYSVSGAFPYNPVTVAAARQALQEAESKYEALKALANSPTMQNGNLITPVTGIVTAINVNPGEVFKSNSTLVTIIDPSKVTLRAKVPLGSMGHIEPGMSATVTPSALPHLRLRGKVVSVIPQADPQTDTFEVQIEVDNHQQMLLPGMSASARIEGKVNAYVVPRIAVLHPDMDASVFLIRNGQAQLKGVHVIGRNKDNLFIDTGLNPNDHIVLLPIDKLQEGQKVNVQRVQR